jgi:nitrite reductase/ring-hydroxylating ferredoxin subunit
MGAASSRLHEVIRRIERTKRLDDVVDALDPFVQRLTASDQTKSALSGTPIGHRLHPMLTDLPIGAWTSAAFLDLLGGKNARTGARRLVALGIAGAIPAAVTGLSDWQDLDRATRRVGLVHLAANSAGLLLQLSSWSARRKGHFFRGKLLSLGALGAVGAGGYLGGHMVFVQRAGVDAEVDTIDGYAWQDACSVSELADSKPVGVEIDGARVVIVRDSRSIYALAARCTHAGGPLDEGAVHDHLIECPWHGSRFALADGAVVRGPATTPEPTYETRVRGDRVEVRRHPIGATATPTAATIPV